MRNNPDAEIHYGNEQLTKKIGKRLIPTQDPEYLRATPLPISQMTIGKLPEGVTEDMATDFSIHDENGTRLIYPYAGTP